MSILLKNGRILEKNKLKKTDILVDGSCIVDMQETINSKSETYDVSGKIILPGLIDPHVHLREPGFVYKEGFVTGGQAAAAGGFCTVIDMPNTNPPTTTPKNLKLKQDLSKKSGINILFYYGIDSSQKDITVPEGVVGVKVFLNKSTGNMIVRDDHYLQSVFSSFPFVAVHAEDEMVRYACELTKKCGNRLYLCHITQKKELDIIDEYRDKIKLFVEVTPHHLFLDNTCAKTPYFSMKPPLRPRKDVDALWNAIRSGQVDTIGSDHAPHTEEDKDSGKPCYGVPGLETSLPLMLNAVNEGKIKLYDVQRLMSENPAKIFDLPKNGNLIKGANADITIIDLELTKKVTGEYLKTKCKWTPFEGMKLKGWPVMTIINGQVSYNNL